MRYFLQLSLALALLSSCVNHKPSNCASKMPVSSSKSSANEWAIKLPISCQAKYWQGQFGWDPSYRDAVQDLFARNFVKRLGYDKKGFSLIVPDIDAKKSADDSMNFLDKDSKIDLTGERDDELLNQGRPKTIKDANALLDMFAQAYSQTQKKFYHRQSFIINEILKQQKDPEFILVYEHQDLELPHNILQHACHFMVLVQSKKGSFKLYFSPEIAKSWNGKLWPKKDIDFKKLDVPYSEVIKRDYTGVSDFLRHLKRCVQQEEALIAEENAGEGANAIYMGSNYFSPSCTDYIYAWSANGKQGRLVEIMLNYQNQFYFFTS